jgi:hypothetical protein
MSKAVYKYECECEVSLCNMCENELTGHCDCGISGKKAMAYARRIEEGRRQMKAMLKKEEKACWGDLSGVSGNLTGVYGDLSGVRGDLTGVSGNLTGVSGDLSGVCGDLNDCEITDEDRDKGINIEELICKKN